MNRKQFLWLMLAVVIMCGAGFALFWQDITAYRDSGAKIGAHLLPPMKVSDVAKLRLQDATSEVTLAVKDKVWRVEQRGGYPADFAEISGLILKLLDAKVVQSEAVGASLHARLNLLTPVKGAKEGTGTLVELSDESAAQCQRWRARRPPYPGGGQGRQCVRGARSAGKSGGATWRLAGPRFFQN